MANNKKIFKPPDEWMKQAEYDIEVAEIMLNTGKYVYAIFMLHLALEKAFKSIYTQTLQSEPPRTHNLILLQERIETKMTLGFSNKQNKLIEFINEKSVPTRYPETLSIVLKEYKKKETAKFVE